MGFLHARLPFWRWGNSDFPGSRAPLRVPVHADFWASLRPSQVLTGRARDRQRGTSLAETIIGLGLFGLVATGFLAAVGFSLNTSGMVQEDHVSHNLARTQMEDVLKLPYSDTGFYPVTVAPPGEFSLSITVVDESPIAQPNSLQRVTVRVDRLSKPVLTLAHYKAKL